MVSHTHYNDNSAQSTKIIKTPHKYFEISRWDLHTAFSYALNLNVKILDECTK